MGVGVCVCEQSRVEGQELGSILRYVAARHFVSVLVYRGKEDGILHYITLRSGSGCRLTSATR